MSSLNILIIYEKFQTHYHEHTAFKSVFSYHKSRESIVLKVPRLTGRTIEESLFDSRYE